MSVQVRRSKNGCPSRNGRTLADGSAPLDTVSTAAGPTPGNDKPAPEGRTAAGRFGPGNTFAQGNPVARRIACLRAALVRDLDEGKMQALGQKLYEQALAGDLAAAKLMLAYAVGRPREAVDPDRLDLDEWAILDARPSRAAFLRCVLDTVRTGLAAEVLLSRPELGDYDKIRRALETLDEEYDEGTGPLTRQLDAEVKARVGR
jgi:hypothetical protein